MKTIFSRHALEQAKIRSIPEIYVKEVIENPGKITDYDGCKEPAVIITVYKTSKIEKYYES
jgi:hypothetical protein